MGATRPASTLTVKNGIELQKMSPTSKEAPRGNTEPHHKLQLAFLAHLNGYRRCLSWDIRRDRAESFQREDE